MKRTKITFFFNQLVLPKLCTGGEIRGHIIANFFKKDNNFDTEIVTSPIGGKSFINFKKIIIGNQSFEKKINHQNTITTFILFFIRTIQSIYHQSKIKTDILYSTGDFFCNIIPCFFIKTIRPKTKFIVVVHHLNENPFKRKNSSFIISSISYFLQRFSFLLIRLKSDSIFVVNNQVKQYFIKKKFSQPITISGNGLDIKLIKSQIKSIKNISQSDHLCYFGRLSPTKGSFDLPLILSQILKTYPNIHLDMVGIALPETKEPLIEKFNQLNCQDHYTIHDFIKEKTDVFKILLQSKVIVFPSYEEGWGISLFESIMTKRPVVAYNLPVFQELFHSKLITAPIGNTSILTKKILHLFKNYQSPSTKKYIKECYLIAQKYDWENVFLEEKKSIINLFK